MNHADPFAIPMRGTVLVEASAGTGKTHRITTLFVRLVLERSLDVAQILVVTFTNAATAELRARVRRRLHEALTAFDLDGTGSDPELVELVRRSRHRDADRAKIARALEDVDRASVFTIHAFCQRVLEEHAFEGGVRFDVELSPNIEPLVVEIVQDFCTQRLGGAPKNAVEYLRANQLGLAALVRTGMYAARMPDAPLIADGMGTDLERAVDEYRVARRRYAEAWSTGKNEVRTLLLSTQALNGNSYSPAIRERTLAEAEAVHAAAEDSLIGISDDFRRLTSGSIRRAVKRNCIEPKHAAFDACQGLVTAAESLNAAFEDWALALQRDLVDRVRSELPARSAEISVMSFDDLIHGVFAALNGPRGRALAATLRRRFPAALIDEFQDTDPVQYDIFRKVYATKGASLFLIGDPKQAIYGFRGADIFAYLEASRQAGEPFTLDTNFRSDPTLVRAVNTVFSRSPEPFLLEGIEFSPVRSPAERADALSLGGTPVSGIDVLFVGKTLPENGRGRTSPKPEMVPELVARDIAQTLASKTTLRRNTSTGKVTEEELHPGHFAVLTRSNKEARDVQVALTALGIPNVLHGDQSVLDTDEADEMARVLDALADPRSADAVRAALSTNLLGLDATALFDLGEDEARWERWTTDFSRWSDLWERSGFLTAMRRLFADLRVSERLLESRGGERRLTNFMHLAELLHREASERRLGVSGLLAWFNLVRLEKSARLDVAPEAQQVRLESDEFRVQLTTMHRSKGLEYPIVYLPFLFGKMGLLQREEHNLRYHDPARENRMVLDIRPKDRKEKAREQAEAEARAEGLRLAYVALTRAMHRTVVVWGPFKDASKSALMHLFDAKHPLRATSGADNVEEETLLEDVRSLARESGGAIRIRVPDGGAAPPWRGDGTTNAALAARALERRLGPGFRTSSFTSLTAGAEAHAPVIDEGRDLDPAAPLDAGPIEPVVVGPKVLLHDFPRGPRAGNALHLALEEADFERKDADELARAVRSSLLRHGFSAPELAPQVTDALASALRTPLLAENPSLRLERVTRDKRVSEMEFTFPLGDERRSRAGSLVTANALAKVLRERKGAPYPRDYPNRVQALGFQPLAGFLRGFIDLVFEHENRFYVVDYKSNYLGDAPSHYRPPALVESMARHHYFLQYHLYCVALHRTLELRLRGYTPAKHWGGVFYLFLRGMAEERGPSTGVFFDRPEPAAIEGLSRTLGTIREARA